MNGNDITGLSYKELQALALRYRVPGNIKKKLLIKILQAAKSGNEREVAKLLHDLKQTRKKRARKMKPGKLGITSTPLHSPDYTMGEDFYSPQQQPPYQWVGAEEEIGTREEDGGIPHYEEFRRFLLRKIQRECRVFDPNNNRVQESTVMDLRTGADQLDVNALPIEKYGYPRPNVITVDETNTCVFPMSSPTEYQILEDPSATAQGSVLLKKMLQAPVGANLGEIASPMIGDYRIWPAERYQTENILDNSDTLTAESDNNGEDNLPSNVDCYGLVDNGRSEYILQDSNFARNTEETAVQLSNILTAENSGQYRYGYEDNNPHHNYQNWPTSNGAVPTELNCVTAVDSESAGTFRTMYYENSELNQANELANNETSNYHFHTNENINYASTSQNALHSTAEGTQYYNHNLISGIQCDTLDTYYLQNIPKSTTEINNSYFTRLSSQPETSIIRGANDIMGQQTYHTEFQNSSNISRDHTTLHCDGVQPLNTPTADYLKHRDDEAIVMRQGSNFQSETGSSGILDPFVPKRPCVSSSNASLENILNLSATRCVDYGKLEQTCCVYCYTAPMVADREAESISSCSRSKGFVAEERQHSFSTYCLIYDDSTLGLRMTNLKINDGGAEGNTQNDKTNEIRCNPPVFEDNSEIRETIDTSDESTINDIWIHDYNELQTPVKENVEAYEDGNEESSDPLGFSMEKHTDDMSMRRA